MNVREMHIEVSQGTQNISANVRRKLLPDEIDWLLYKNQERFIQSKVKPRKDGSGGFQINQVDADAIRTLLTTNVISLTTVDDNDVYESQLPADYSYLISDDSRTHLLCGEAGPMPSGDTMDVLQLQFKDSQKSNGPYYTSFSITIGTVVTTLAEIVAAYSANYNGVNSKSERYLIKDVILWYLRNVKKIDVYWETYKSIYKPNTFLVPGVSTGSMTVDSYDATVTTQTLNIQTLDSDAGTWVPNRLSSSEKISTLLVTPFVKPSAKSPISEVSGNKLTVYGDSSFIVTGVRVDYIKKPRRINLLLAQDCELPEEFHQAICDLTVEYFKVMTVDPSWEMKLKDNINRSTT
jgi:hypothetical protein